MKSSGTRIGASSVLLSLLLACTSSPNEQPADTAQSSGGSSSSASSGSGGQGGTGSTANHCGNGIVDSGEQCDGDELAGANCEGLGYAGGTLVCSGCQLDESGCVASLADPAVFRAADLGDVCGLDAPQDCTPADMAFISTVYGTTVTRADAGPVTYRLMALVERVGPSNIDVLVVDELGSGLSDIPVAFYYDTAPEPSRPDEWYPVKVTATTNADGRAGFALAPSAYLQGCGSGGPHAIWVSEPGAAPDTTTPSDLVDRLGMLGNTNHRHLDLLFQRVAEGQEPVVAVTCPLL